MWKAAQTEPLQGTITWQSPSNIALVKYWGKHGIQLPANPSISFTLGNCHTVTRMDWTPNESDALNIRFYFDGEEKPDFLPKIEQFFERIKPYVVPLSGFDLEIHSHNSFPHSSGIASSASSMSALALCVCSWERQFTEVSEEAFYQKASLLARLGSGSACRSVYGGLVAWGTHADIPAASDEYGVPYVDVHPLFKTYKDTVLLVDRGQKTVSSTVGHNLMHAHPFADQRFAKAHENLSELLTALNKGDLQLFTQLVEAEALMLHAMMMTSSPHFILFKPNTLAIIEKVWAYRKETGSNLGITLDAGANVHLLYPHNEEKEALALIDSELARYCQKEQYICDGVGLGPSQQNQQP